MLFFNANFICYYFYPTKKREEPKKNLCEYAIPLIRKNNEHITIEMFNYAESL